jgi:hypothetical protein
MNEFDKIVVTDLSTFQFKPDVDMVLVTENNIKALEKMFNQQSYVWVDNTKLIARKSSFKVEHVLFVYNAKKVTHGTIPYACSKLQKYMKSNPDKPNPASEYIFVEV